jgi:hypothetical protein
MNNEVGASSDNGANENKEVVVSSENGAGLNNEVVVSLDNGASLNNEGVVGSDNGTNENNEVNAVLNNSVILNNSASMNNNASILNGLDVILSTRNAATESVINESCNELRTGSDNVRSWLLAHEEERKIIDPLLFERSFESYNTDKSMENCLLEAANRTTINSSQLSRDSCENSESLLRNNYFNCLEQLEEANKRNSHLQLDLAKMRSTMVSKTNLQFLNTVIS